MEDIEQNFKYRKCEMCGHEMLADSVGRCYNCRMIEANRINNEIQDIMEKQDEN